VSAAQVAGAHQELARDLAAGEAEGLFEELHPLGLGARVMCVEPGAEGAEPVADAEEALRILDGGIDLEAIADDADVAQQPCALAAAVGGDPVGVEAVVGGAEGVALLQDGQPRESCLVDLEHQALEERRVVVQGEAVLAIVVGAVEGVAGRDAAVGQGRRLS